MSDGPSDEARQGATCPTCGGSGLCPTCHGNGKYVSGGVMVDCTACIGDGVCARCHGTGTSPSTADGLRVDA